MSKKTLGLIVILVLLFTSYPVKISYSSEQVDNNYVAQLEWTREQLEDLVQQKALEYNVSAEVMKRIINCESGWNYEIQSRHKYTAGQISRNPHWGVVGEYEKSFGLVQIHIPAHNVTIEQATDPIFAVDFLADNLAKGNANWWTCY